MLCVIEKCLESCWCNKIKILLILWKSSNSFTNNNIIVMWLFSFATKCSYLVAILQLDFLFSFKPCTTYILYIDLPWLTSVTLKVFWNTDPWDSIRQCILSCNSLGCCVEGNLHSYEKLTLNLWKLLLPCRFQNYSWNCQWNYIFIVQKIEYDQRLFCFLNFPGATILGFMVSVGCKMERV